MDLSQIDMLGKCELAGPGRHLMTIVRENNTGAGWRKVLALILGVIAVGLPINNISDYALLVILTVVIFCGDVSARRAPGRPRWRSSSLVH
jgi:hypothetical protein